MRYIAILCLLTLLHSCGFQLRGSESLNVSTLYVQQDNAPITAGELTRLLQQRGITIAPLPSLAQAIVKLSNEAVDHRVLSVSATTSKVEEIELNFRVNLEVQKLNGEVLLEKQNFSLLRDYSYDQNAVLASSKIEEVLRQELFNRLMSQLMWRLQTLALGKLEITEIAFEGLQKHYRQGDRLQVALIEETPRQTAVDIWVQVLQEENAFYLVAPEVETINEAENKPEENNAEQMPWHLSTTPKPWRTDVTNSQTHHRLLDTVANMDSGTYTLRALFLPSGNTLDLTKPQQMRSPVITAQIQVEALE